MIKLRNEMSLYRVVRVLQNNIALLDAKIDHARYHGKNVTRMVNKLATLECQLEANLSEIAEGNGDL